MRLLLTILGTIAIIAYAIIGALLMSRWTVSIAANVPLDTAIEEMASAGQPYSTVPGIVFASLGVLLALLWAVAALPRRRAQTPAWAAVAVWAGILTLGAPAYFLASFSNLNSVGDTFFDWNSEAVFAVEAPLYLVSGLALIIVLAAAIVGIVRAVRGRTGPAGLASQNAG